MTDVEQAGRRGTERGDAARRTIVETAERMYAERGLNGVSLREIGAAAGQLNTGAARYHFGSKLGLINAVFELRMAPINAARERMLDHIETRAEIERTGDTGDVRRLAAAFALPLAGALGTRERPSWYLRFAVQAGHVDGSAPTRLADQPWTRGIDRLRALLLAAIDVPEPLQALRWTTFAAHIGHALADRERELQEPARPGGLPHDLFISALLDTAVALLGAPVSPSTDHLLSGVHA